MCEIYAMNVSIKGANDNSNDASVKVHINKSSNHKETDTTLNI